MKKTSKIIALAAMTMTMVAGMATFVFAADAMTATEFYYGTEVMATQNITYNDTNLVPSKYPSAKESGAVIPVTVTKAGTVACTVTAVSLTKDVEVGLYSDATCTNEISGGKGLDLGAVSSQSYIAVSNPGTYYLKISTMNWSEANFTNSVNVSVGNYTLEEKTIKNNETINFCKGSYNQQFTFKYVPTATGLVMVNCPYIYGTHVTLLDENKGEISDSEWLSDSMTNGTQCIFAVQKGKTYYFLVDSNGYSVPIQSITVAGKAVKEKSGISKKKAVTMKKKKAVKGTVIANAGKADWYKFKLTKNKVLNIYISGVVSGSFKVTVYGKGGKQVGSTTCSGESRVLRTLYGKSPKGTYYIKVERANNKSGGMYSIKWK